MSSPTADRLTSLLADPNWQPTREHVEEARNALTLNAATLEESEDEVDRLSELCQEQLRQLVRLRPAQAGMIYAAANYAGLHGELTVAQYEAVQAALKADRDGSWHSMCEQLAATLGVEFPHAEKPKKPKKPKKTKPSPASEELEPS